MSPPKGYSVSENIVLKINKSFYGLKQVLRVTVPVLRLDKKECSRV